DVCSSDLLPTGSTGGAQKITAGFGRSMSHRTRTTSLNNAPRHKDSWRWITNRNPSTRCTICSFTTTCESAKRHSLNWPHVGDKVAKHSSKRFSKPIISWQEYTGSGAWVNLCAEMKDRKSTRLNSSHVKISYAVFCLKKKKERQS